MAVTSRLAVEPSATFRWTDLPRGTFTTQQYRARMFFAFSPWMFLSGLLQYNTNSHIVATNLRLRWEYTPGSELFVVYNEQRDTRFGGAPDLQNRAFIVKFNRLFRM